VGLIAREKYREAVDEVILFLKGRNRQLLGRLQAKMAAAAEARRYELAARYRDALRAIEKVFESQKAQGFRFRDLDAHGAFRQGDEVAIQESVNTRKGVERCIRYAFEVCRKRNKKKRLTLCGKTNVLIYESDLWFRVFEEVSKKYPDVETNYQHVDAICMWMIKNPEQFDVIVTTNLFGDIITDLGAIIQGGLGIAAGGNINPEGAAMFEPMGGSAPKYTGLNVINPMAAIAAAQMMVDFLGEKEAAEILQRAMKAVLKNHL
jgi:3-isopropylmalate dehydrogenase